MKKNILLIFLFIAFYFSGNRLYWVNTENSDQSCNFLELQLNHNMPPDINQKDISSIKVTKDEVFVIAGSKCWILHYNTNGYSDWFVEDYFEL